MVLGISSFTYGWAAGADQDLTSTSMTEAELVKKATEFGVKCIQLGDNLPVVLAREHVKYQVEVMTKLPSTN